MELKRRQRRELTPRQGKYITGLSEGKSRRQAALDAGYSQACADNPRYTIESAPVRKELGRIIRRYVDPNKIGPRISEGLSATKTRFFQHQGVITERIKVVAWDERLAYVQLAAEFCGYVGDTEEVDRNSNTTDLSSRTDEELGYFTAHGV